METAEPLKLALIALLVFIVLIALARLFRITFAFLSRKFEHVTPKPVARLLGIFLALALFWSVADGLLLKAGLRLADSSFRELDCPDRQRSRAACKSLEDRQQPDRSFLGRILDFAAVNSSPPARRRKRSALSFNQPALEPIRVYVGLNAAETAKDRAALALAELKRTGAFERSTLIVVVPTGTGWVDPAAMDTVEYLHHGDVASVALQYSYLTSWLSLLVEPSYGAEAGRGAVQDGLWLFGRRCRRTSAPKLYLHGLSLGALNSERSADLFDVIGDPFQGALWSGPPFASAGWKSATAGREPGSPAWLPRFRDSSVIRFTAQKNALDIPGASWGPMRIVYLQYASDPRDLLRSPFLLPGAGLDEAAAWPRCLTLSALVSGRHHAAAGVGYGDRPRRWATATSMRRNIISMPGWRSPIRKAWRRAMSSA